MHLHIITVQKANVCLCTQSLKRKYANIAMQREKIAQVLVLLSHQAVHAASYKVQKWYLKIFDNAVA